MKLVVNHDLCEANGTCVDCFPEAFRLEEDDSLTLLMEDVPSEYGAKAKEAVMRCPRQAIKLED